MLTIELCVHTNPKSNFLHLFTDLFHLGISEFLSFEAFILWSEDISLWNRSEIIAENLASDLYAFMKLGLSTRDWSWLVHQFLHNNGRDSCWYKELNPSRLYRRLPCWWLYQWHVSHSYIHVWKLHRLWFNGYTWYLYVTGDILNLSNIQHSHFRFQKMMNKKQLKKNPEKFLHWYCLTLMIHEPAYNFQVTGMIIHAKSL